MICQQDVFYNTSKLFYTEAVKSLWDLNSRFCLYCQEIIYENRVQDVGNLRPGPLLTIRNLGGHILRGTRKGWRGTWTGIDIHLV